MGRNVLSVNWKVFDGASYKRKVLHLRSNADGVFLCPITNCLHLGFKSQRGLRKHIDCRHPWYYYFEEEPKVKREEVVRDERVKLKQPTHNIPSFSVDEGIGKSFLEWLCTPLGGGKVPREGKQIAKRAMKFLLAALGDFESGSNASAEYVDCCLGSPAVVIKFMETVTKEWGLTSSAALNYLKSMSDLLDFRKANGVGDVVLRSFAVTEVYIRRGKDNLGKRKRMEYSRNLDLESLIARESWASIEEMEGVIPFHAPRFKQIADKCSEKVSPATISELAFATRFVATFLFLRVKCSRPMTFQQLTVEMVEKAKMNGGFIDQTEFKTASKYVFDTLIITPEVVKVLDCYIYKIRPSLNPTCHFLLVTTNGTQYTAFTSAMSLLVKEAIGKYINPTRYRQIIETESTQRLTPEEQKVVSKDQKHASTVAERSYKKQLSREVATESKKCIEKMLGQTRNMSTQQLAGIFSTISDNTEQFDQAVIAQTESNLGVAANDMQTVNLTQENLAVDGIIPARCTTTDNLNEDSTEGDVVITGTRGQADVAVAATSPKDTPTSQPLSQWPTIVTDVHVKKEIAEGVVRASTRANNKFTKEEDRYLKRGIDKYGKGHWNKMLRDPELKFHECRSRDSLRVRAESCAFRIVMKLKI